MKTIRVHKNKRLLSAFALRVLVVSLLLIFVVTLPVAAEETEETPQTNQQQETADTPAESVTGDTNAAPAEDVAEDMEGTPTEDMAVDTDEAPAVFADQVSTLSEGDGGDSEDDTVIGAGDTEDETYSVPSGSAYVYEMGQTLTYENDANEGNAIQQGLEAALTYIQGLYENEDTGTQRVATLVVSNGTYENGITLDASQEEDNTLWSLVKSILGYQSQDNSQQLTLRIVAEDAIEYDDKGNITGFNAEASGQVQLEGDINILAGNLNLNLVLAGLYLSTRGLVNAEGVDELTVYGTEKDDYMTINATGVGSSVTVNTGAGDDVVTANVSGRAGVTAQVVTCVQLDVLLRMVTDLSDGSVADAASSAIFPDSYFGEGFDFATWIQKNVSTIKNLQNQLTEAALEAAVNPIGVNISTGDGNDKLNLKLVDSTRLESGEIDGTDVNVDLSAIYEEMAEFPVSWLTRLSLYVDVSAYDVHVDGGNGADELTITGERDSSNAYPLVKAASDYVYGERGFTPTASVSVAGGAGDDVITVDSSVFLATRGTTEISADGGSGFNRLHLTGKLDDDAAQPISAKVTTSGVDFTIQALAALVINDGYTTIDYKLSYPGVYSILTENVDAFTDRLENKNTVYIRDLTENVTAEAFTNYVVEPGNDEKGTVAFDASDYLIISGDLLLTGILVQAGDDQLVTIEKLLAPDLNVTIDSDKIEVTGTVTGRNILLIADAEDRALIEIDASGSVDTGLADGILPSEVEIEGASLGIYETTTTIYITIGSSAKLIATQAVALNARLHLYHDYIPGLELLDEDTGDIRFNPVTVKMGNATISITGTIHAGGAVQIAADVDIDVDVTNGTLKAIIPVAIGVVGGKAVVTVNGNADIRSGLGSTQLESKALPMENAGVLLRADSALKILAHAGSGVFPISVALAVVDFTTTVTVGGNAAVIAGGDVELLARNHTVTSASVCGYETNKYSVKVKSGVFIAGTYAGLTTGAQLEGAASLRSVQGGVRLNGVSRMNNTTVSVAIPSSTGDTGLTLSTALPILAKLIDLGGIAKSVAPKLLEKAGLDKLGQLFSSSAGSAGDGNQSVTQALGAFAWTYLDNDTYATINTSGTVQAALTLSLYALGEVRSEVRGDGSLYKVSKVADTPKTAIGAGLALVILNDKVEALISNGTITAGNLDVRALLGDCSSTAVAKSGDLPEDQKNNLGLAGAVGVQLSSFENIASIASGVTVKLLDGASITVIAQGSGWFVTVGDASGMRKRLSLDLGAVQVPLKAGYNGSAESKAIGAGIAVDTIGVNTLAEIQDGVTITMTSGRLNGLTVTASFEATQYTEAAAGAKGGTSMVPVLALSLGGMDVNACVGTGSGLTLTGDVAITANGCWERTLVADAKTGGAKVGVGAAVGLAMSSDNVTAALKRSITAYNINIEASSVSRVTETVYASAQGVTPSFGSGSYGQGTGSDGSATQEDVEKLISGSRTDSAETGSVGGVDSLINKLVSTLSGLAGKLPQSKSGNLSSDSVNNMGSSRSPAGTGEGNVEVAAAIAVNIQFNSVSASIGDGLALVAIGDIHVLSLQDTDAVISANASAVKSTVGVGVAVAVNCVHYNNQATIGTSKLSADGDIQVKATIYEEEEKRAVEEILSELVKYFASQNGMDVLLGAIAKNQGTTVDALMNSLLEKYHSDFASLTDAQKKALSDEITAMLMASLSDEPLDTSVTLATDVLESILGEFRDMVSDPDFFLELFLGDGDEMIEEAFAQLKLDGRMTLQSLRSLLAAALTEKFGNASELDGIGCRISTVSISGEGASNVGVAGSVAISYVEGITLAQIADRTTTVGDDIVAGGIVTIEGNGAQKIYTTATASTVANGAPDKNTGGSSAGTSVGVGASFAMTLVDASSKAIVGQHRSMTALALGVQATVQNDVDTIAVAGQDPIGVQQKTAQTTPALGASEAVKNANNSTPDDIAADAAVALTILSNTVYAQICSGCILDLTGGNVISSELERGDSAKDTLYDLVVNACQRGQTLTNSSGFAVGGKVAVGASVAANVAGSDVLASLSGSGSVKGRILVDALTFNEDEVNGLAVITGVNLDRYLSKLRSIVDLANTTDKPSTGGINADLVNAINGKAGGAASAASNKALPTSSVLLQKLNISLPDVKSDDGVDKDLLSGSDSQGMDHSASGQSVNIAAALGVNITNHMSVASLTGNFTAGGARVNAENKANFRTTGSGAAVTTGTVGSNNISAGVAVSVNNNKTESILGGTLDTGSGNVNLAANSTTNMDGKYPGLLAAQALAGAVGGSGGKVGLAGAVAVVIDQSRTSAYTQDGTQLNAGDITLSSTDKSKLALRAGALQAGGQTLGVGASFAVLYARNRILAGMGSNNTVDADNLTVQAIREKITAGDYVFPFDWDTLFTVNVPDDDSANKGLININVSDSSSDNVGDNSLELNTSAEDLLNIIDLLNYGTMTNYYVEAIAGGIAGGAASKLGLAGAVSFIYATTDTTARIGDDSVITLRGELKVTAENETRVRQIAGALGASRQTGVGVNMTGFVNEAKRTTWDANGNATNETLTDQTAALVGSNVTITAPDGIQVNALADLDIFAIAIAAGVTASGNGASIGGTISTIAGGNVVKALVGQGSTLTANNESIQISADNTSFLLSMAASVAGGVDKVAAGGTISVIVVENETIAAMGDRVQATAGKNITIKATSRETLVNWFDATAISTGSNVAGIISVLVTGSNTTAELGDNAYLTAGNGSIEIQADGDVFQVVVLTNACVGAGSGAATVGAVVSADVFRQEVAALVGSNARLIAQKDVEILANGRNRVYLVTAAGSIGTSGVSVSGVITTVVSQTNVHAELGSGTGIKAGDTIQVSAELDTDVIFASPNIAATAGNAGVGATVSTFVVKNTVQTLIGDQAKLIACAGAEENTASQTATSREDRRRGIFLRANANNRLIVAAVCAGASSNAAVAGTITTVVVQNKTIAQTGDAVVLVSGYDCELDADPASASVAAGDEGDVSVEADEDSHIYLLAIDVSVSGTASVAGGSNALVFQSQVLARLGGTVRSVGDVTLRAQNTMLVVNAAGAVAGSGNAAVVPVAVVTYYKGSTQAIVGTGSDIVAGGDFTLAAYSKETLSSDAIGAGASGTAAVSGAVVVTVSTQITRALVQANVCIRAADLSVTARDDIGFLTAVGVVAAGGNAGVGIIAAVTVLHNTVESKFTGGTDTARNIIQSTTGNITVTAKSNRDIRAYGLDVSASGVAAVAPTVMVTVIGGKMDSDSTTILQSGFDADAFTQIHFGDGEEMSGLSQLLETDGRSYSDTELGDNGNADYSDGYISDDFDNSGYNDSGDTGRGEDYTVTPESNSVISAVDGIFTTTESYDPMDAVTAIIGSVKMISAGDINVLAEDMVQLEIFNAAISGSGIAAVGVGLSVAVLYSNVVAGVDAGATLYAVGDITVNAVSHSAPYVDSTDEDLTRNSALSATLDQNVKVTERTLRVVSMVAGGSTVAVSVVGSAVSLSNRTIAYMNGNVTGAASLNVLANASYPNTLAVTFGGSGGLVAVNASFAVALTWGQVKAYIDGNAKISGVTAIKVSTDSDFNATAASAALAGGAAAVSGGVAVAVNRMQVRTFLGKNVTISGATDLNVVSTHTSNALAYLLNVAAGAGAATLNGVVVIVSPEIFTYIGVEPGKTDTGSGAIGATHITVTSNVTSEAKPLVGLAAAGSGTISGVVIVVINKTNAITGSLRKNINTTDLTINANMTAVAEAKFSAASAGSTNLGATIAYILLQGSNEAVLDLTGVSVSAAAVRITADSTTNGQASALIVSAGGATANVNTAIADNHTTNIAHILADSGARLYCTGDLTVQATGTATALAEVTGLNLSSVSINGTIAIAVLRNIQQAAISGGTISAANISLSSELNTSVEDSSKAIITMGDGSLVKVQAFIALAYGRSESTAILQGKRVNASGTLTVTTRGNAGTLAQIRENSGLSGITATVMAAFAYAQGKFRAVIQGGNVSAKTISVLAVDILTGAVAELTPSGLGAKVSLTGIEANLAVANAKATIEAKISGGTITTTATDTGAQVTVKAVSTSTAKATIYAPTVVVSRNSVAANVSVALLKTTQEASIRVTGVSANGTIQVLSELNKDYTGNTAEATARGNALAASVYGGKVNVIVARSRASSIASITGGVRAYGISLTSDSVSRAFAMPGTAANSLSLVGVGINTVFAEASGTFRVLLNAGGATITAGDGGITMDNSYTTSATASSGQSKKGVGISGVNGQVNCADASTNATAQTTIQGTGSITATGSLNMTATGTATATATIGGQDFGASVITVVTNLATATVGGTQTVGIEGGTVNASGISLKSQFNNDRNYAAQATVGSSSGSKISYAAVQANLAKAIAQATVVAKIDKATVTSSGDISVSAQGSSRAKADVSVGTTITAVNATVLSTLANAASSFTAQVSDAIVTTTGTGNVTVKADSTSNALAYTANSGDVQVSAVSGKYNVATATAAGSTIASFTGKGAIAGDLKLQAKADVDASAAVTHPQITIDLVNLAVNQTQATLSASQMAFLSLTGALSVDGTVTVDSQLTGDAASDVGGGEGNVKISALTADINATKATSKTSNKACITGAADLTAGAVTVQASSETTAKATTKTGYSASLASFGGLTADANTQDQVTAYVEKVTMTAYSLAITAQCDATASAESLAMGSTTGVSSLTSEATAGVGSSTSSQTVSAGIGSSATITLTGSLTIQALNEGEATANITRGTSTAISSQTKSKLPTVSYYSTRAYVGAGSDIRAGGNVTITAQDTTEATSQASSKEISFAVSSKQVYGSNTITTNTLTEIGSASIFASGNLTIQAISNTTMLAKTLANGGSGFKDRSALMAENTLTRTNKVTIASGASLTSDFGDVEILAQAGADDSIKTHVELSGAGFAAYEKVSATTTISTTSTVTVGKATITDTFGTVHIWSDASMDTFYTYAYANAGGVGTEPSATATDTITLNSSVSIDGTASYGAQITGRNVEIHARFTKLSITSYAFAKTKSLGSNTDGMVVQTVNLTGSVTIGNASLRAYDYLRVTATGVPNYQSNNIYARAKIYLGAIGHGKAEVVQKVTSSNTVTVNAGVAVYSANATIRAQKFSGTIGRKCETSGFVYQQKKESDSSNSLSASTRVNNGTLFYIGDAAAGIVIDIYEKDGSVQVRQVGLKNEKSIWTINSSNRSVLLQAIANNLAGYLTMGVTYGSYKVYDQQYIPSVSITNRTDYSLELKGLTVENDNYIQPRVTLGGGSYTVANTNITQPVFEVISYGTGNVHLSGLIANPRGSVSFLWKGKIGGDLTGREKLSTTSLEMETAPIWAHNLTIRGAVNLGSSTSRLAAWLITHSGEKVTALNQASDITLEASGDVYLSLTPVWMKTVAAESWESLSPDNSAFNPNTDVSHIASDGNVDILLKQGVRLYRKAGTATVTMPVPGTLEYITDALVGLTTGATISDRAALEYYLESYDLVTGISVYYLPNGTRLYTDETGAIVRIVEGGVDFGLGEYSYDATTNTITLAEGVKFNLTNGTLTVQDGYSYEALLSAISGKWLLDRIQNGTFQLFYLQEAKTEGGKDTRVNLTLTEWYQNGTSTWYYTSMGGAPTGIIGSSADGVKNYILVYDSSTDTLRAYLLTSQGDGGTSNTIREELSFYDDYYIKNVDKYYDQDSTVEVTEYWDPTIKSIKKTLNDGNEYYLVEKDPDDYYVDSNGNIVYYYLPLEKLADKVSFTSFLSLSGSTTGLSGFQSINYNTSSGKWTVTYQNGRTIKTVELDVVSLGSGCYGVAPDAADSTSDAFLKALYTNLSGSCWKVKRNQTDSINLNIAVYADSKDATTNERLYAVYQSWYLYAYAYTLTYATLSEIGMAVSPEEDKDASYTHGVCFETDPDFSGTVIITGKTENIAMKEVTLPTSSLLGSGTTTYRITDSLYIQNSGTNKGRAILLSGSFVATYNSVTCVYESTKVKLTNLTPGENEAAYCPTIVIKSGEQVMLEAVTDTIARDLKGNYYQKTDGVWSLLTDTTTEESRDGVYVDKTLGTTIDGVTVYTTTLKDTSGTVLLTIQQAKTTLYVIGENENGILAGRTVNGQTEYYLLTGGIWISVEENTAEGMGFELTLGTRSLTMTASTYITLPGGRIVGSDGTVEIPGDTVSDQTAQIVSGTQYQLGDITGATVTITMEDPSGSLIDANDTSTEKKTNITSTVGDVTFVTSSTGSIGTAENPLEINTAGEVKFRNLSGEDRLETDVYLKSDKDITLGDVIVDGRGEYGDTTLVVNSTAGSIIFGSMTVMRGGLVNLTAAKDILSSGNLTITTASPVTMAADGSIALGEISVADGSSLTATAGQNLTFDVLEAVDSHVTLSAGGNIQTTRENGYIYFRRDTTGKLTLSAQGDIGGADRYLIVDTNDILYIDHVGSYYLDAVELEGDTAFQRRRPASAAEGSGRDENGAWKTGELLLSGVAQDTVYGELGIEFNTELAQIIVARQDKQNWIGLLTTDALVSQIRSGILTEEDLQTLLYAQGMDEEELFQQIAELLGAETESGYEQLAAMLLTAQLTDEELITLLANALDEDLVDIDEIAQMLAKTLTPEELAQMLENAWNRVDYGDYDTTRPGESTPRAFRIDVGESTGAAFVNNVGDIQISQRSGTLTAGAISSSRGNVTLTALSGGIEGNGDDLTDITGESITLTASAGVGANTPLTIQQQVCRPTLVGNVTKPTGETDTIIRPVDANGDPTEEAAKADSPWVDFGLETIITFQWIRTAYTETATRLNITAGADVNIIEVSGDLGLGVINAKGNVSLSAPGSILDNRSAGQTGENITATGDVTLNAQEGTIGTRENSITTDVDGGIHAEALEDISIRDSGDLDLVADSKNGRINTAAALDLNLSNTRGDLVLGTIVADGTATIVSEGSILEGQVTAKSIELTAKNGDIGTPENPLNVDTDAENGGTLTASGTNVYLKEGNGDLILSNVRASGDAVITANGSILDGNPNATDAAVDAQKEAANADAAAKAAEAESYIKSEEARLALEALEEAQRAYDEALARGNDLALKKAQEALDEAQQTYDAAQTALEEANARARQKRQKAKDKQAQADAAAEAAANAQTTVEAGGDLTLIAGGNIGAEDNSLSVSAGGTVTADGENICIAGVGNMNLSDVDVAGDVRISTVDGDITCNGTITADSLDVSAIHGDVGQEDNSLQLSVKHLDAMGDNVYIHNDQNTQIGQIIGETQVILEVDGDVTADPTTQPNIIAGDATVIADGDIGTRKQPVDISADGFHGEGANIHLDNHTGDLDISHVKADSLQVDTDGNVTGSDNRFHDIIIRADGYVGTEKDPFTFWADGYVSIHGGLGAWFRNLYSVTFRITVVLRFDVTIDGRDYSLYVLVGIDDKGEFTIIGWFLCQGKASSEIWTEVLDYLYNTQRIFSLGTVIVDEEPELEACLERFRDTTCLDIHERAEEAGYERALQEALGAYSDELKTFIEAIEEELNQSFSHMDAAQDALEAFAQGFTEENEHWKLASNAIALVFED